MSQKAISRRSFMTGCAAAGVAGWLYDSHSLGARVIRGVFDDTQRKVVRIAPADLAGWSDKTVDVCWVGHGTILVNMFGLHVLTDPVLFDWVGAQAGIATIGRKRLVAPALDPERLPRIDLVLLSHAHMDHLDMPSLAALPKSATVVTAPNTSDLVRGFGFKSLRELRWNENVRVATPSGEIEVEGAEVNHWGARWKTDKHRGFLGFVLKRGGKTVLFAGDTAQTGAFGALRGRGIEVGLMPIGSYGKDSRTHCTPEEAVSMLDACGAEFIVPFHHSTFPIGQEPLREPLERLENAIKPERIALKQIGQTWRLPA